MLVGERPPPHRLRLRRRRCSPASRLRLCSLRSLMLKRTAQISSRSCRLCSRTQGRSRARLMLGLPSRCTRSRVARTTFGLRRIARARVAAGPIGCRATPRSAPYYVGEGAIGAKQLFGGTTQGAPGHVSTHRADGQLDVGAGEVRLAVAGALHGHRDGMPVRHWAQRSRQGFTQLLLSCDVLRLYPH